MGRSSYGGRHSPRQDKPDGALPVKIYGNQVLAPFAVVNRNKLQMILEIFNGTAAQTLDAKFKALSACPVTE